MAAGEMKVDVSYSEDAKMQPVRPPRFCVNKNCQVFLVGKYARAIGHVTF